jgi:AraC-like DNA-binding protein
MSRIMTEPVEATAAAASVRRFHSQGGFGVVDVDESLVPAFPRRFAVLHRAGPEEVRAYTSRVLTPYRATPVGGDDVVADISVAGLGPVSLIHLRSHGDELRVQFTETVSYYDVNLAVDGVSLLECGDDQVILGRRTAGIISPQMRAKMHLSDGYSQLHVRIERYALERHLERMLGRPVPGPVRFRLGMDLTAPALASWVRAVGLLVRDLEDPAGLCAQGDGAGPWAEFLISGLLRAQPHDYSEALARRDATWSFPARVRRVVDLIDDDPGGDLSLSRLAAEAGVAPRSLQRDFQIYLGVSPRQYVERVRLARARADLLAGAGSSVADIAYRWGFGHASRFAGAYQKKYGETPSQTLRAKGSAGRRATGISTRPASRRQPTADTPRSF